MSNICILKHKYDKIIWSKNPKKKKFIRETKKNNNNCKQTNKNMPIYRNVHANLTRYAYNKKKKTWKYSLFDRGFYSSKYEF